MPDSLRARLEAAGIIGPERGQFRFVTASCSACETAQTQAVPTGAPPAKCIECEEPIE